MTADALSLDLETVDAQTLRRLPVPHGIGSSDVALAMLSGGHRPMETAPRWMREKAERMKRCGLPRWIAEKVGAAVKPKQNASMMRGVAREPEILDAWIARLERDEWHREEERSIDPASVMWAGAMPSEWPPLRDKRSPVVVKPDGWARTWRGDYVAISIKCARYGMHEAAWWNGITDVPWYYATQLVAEFAVIERCPLAMFLVGCGWNREDEDPREDGPLLALPYWRDEREVDEVRDVAREAWAIVEPRISRR